MFWDAFVFRVLRGLGEGHFVGYPHAVAVLERARERGLLVIDQQLDPLTITLLLLACPVGAPLHDAALAVQGDRPRDPLDVWDDLRHALPPYLVDLHRLARARQPRQQAMMQGVFRSLLVPALTEYLMVSAQVEQAVAAPLADTLFLRTFADVEPHSPTATRPMRFDDRLLVRLYRSLRRSPFPNAPGPWPLLSEWRDPPPTWRPAENERERRFLDSCLDHLEPGPLELIYLSFYARLNVRQITFVVRPNREWTVPDATLALRDAWFAVLDGI